MKQYYHSETNQDLGHITEWGEPSTRQIHRSHLLDCFRERVPESMYSLGKRLKSIQTLETGSPYLLSFTDGTTVEADIIIGCDGIKSTVREYLGFQDHPTYSGQVVYRGYVSYSDISAATAKQLRDMVIFRGRQKHILTMPIGREESGTDRVGVIGFMTEALDGWQSESWLKKAPIDDMYKHVEDWCPAVQDLMKGLRKASPDGLMLKQALYVRDPIDKWFEIAPEGKKGGILLLGDSVHSTLPHQGLIPWRYLPNL